MFAKNFILQSFINNLQAVKGLRFSPRLVYSLWLRCYCLPWYFLPQFPFLPILLPSFSFPRPPQEKCAWFLLCDTALFVRQRLSYWIISQSKSSAREARRGRTLEGRFRPHPILASFRHQKYTKTGWLHGGMTKGWSPSFILKRNFIPTPTWLSCGKEEISEWVMMSNIWGWHWSRGWHTDTLMIIDIIVFLKHEAIS